jgi:putative addiction module component (TIGR02574 family)
MGCERRNTETDMSETVTTLLDQLLKLSEADRALIADRLWESLSDEKQEELMDETTSDPEFQAELQRRLDSIADGTAELIPWEQARVTIREELERRRAARKQGEQP